MHPGHCWLSQDPAQAETAGFGPNGHAAATDVKVITQPPTHLFRVGPEGPVDGLPLRRSISMEKLPGPHTPHSELALVATTSPTGLFKMEPPKLRLQHAPHPQVAEHSRRRGEDMERPWLTSPHSQLSTAPRRYGSHRFSQASVQPTDTVSDALKVTNMSIQRPSATWGRHFSSHHGLTWNHRQE